VMKPQELRLRFEVVEEGGRRWAEPKGGVT
jgi:hypothetical protein